MKSTSKYLGDYIQLVDERNTDLLVERLLGINITKNFMPSVANVNGLDFSRYKIIKKEQFACNVMHVGRDERLPIALYMEDDEAIVSPAYQVFEVIDKEEVLPEFLMIEFQSPEFDRFTWFICDSSIRGGLEWERFCEIQIPIPDIDEQRKYVALYKNLIKNQKVYERSLDNLRLICDSYMEDLKEKIKPEEVGEYIQQTDERNTDLKIDKLLGISVNKMFTPSKSKKEDLNLASYKVVRERQFAYVTVTSRNGDKISIALLEGETGLVSSTYVVFEVIDKKKLLPEFLFLWIKRSEFDRYVRFHSWGSARETFDWDEMCKVKLPIPDIKVQQAIVAIHHTLESRKRINEKLKKMIKPLCPVLMKGVVENLVKQTA